MKNIFCRKHYIRLYVCIGALLLLFASAQAFSQTQFDVKLWSEGLPNSNGHDDGAEQTDKGIYTPEIRAFLPDSSIATGRAILACPGGGYTHLALENEGYDWAEFYNGLGIAYFVLKYRMPFGNPEVPLSDAVEAMRIIRKNAEEWRVNPYDVGIMGSSAGGHLASTVATAAPFDARPDFQILFYPVISMELGETHSGSVYSLLGKDPSEELQQANSSERRIRRHFTAPAILLVSTDDMAVPVSNSLKYYAALLKNGIPASMHVYPSGGHGWGFKSSFECHEQMLADLTAWLEGLDAPAANAVRVACVGNSITDGHGIPLNDVYAWPGVLDKKLGTDYHVRNFGVSGYTMLQNGDHPYMKHDAYAFCKTFNPDIIVIKLGTNDSKPYNWAHKDEFLSDAQKMIDEFKALPAKPEIFVAYPIKAMENKFEISDSVIVNDIIPFIDELVEKNDLKVIDLHSVFEGHSDWLLPDGVHPNMKGDEVIAEEVMKAITAGKE